MRTGKGVVRAGKLYDNINHFDKKMFRLAPSLKEYWQSLKYFKQEPKFDGVYSRDLPRIKNKAYVINLDDKQNKGTHWVSLFIDRNEIQLCALIVWNQVYSSRT